MTESRLRRSTIGMEYQTIILSQCFWRVLKNGLTDFLVAAEWPGAEKFNDTLVRYEHHGEGVVRLLHVEDEQSIRSCRVPNKINLDHWLSVNRSDKYRLVKYFHLFQEIQAQYFCQSDFFVDCTFQDLVLLTNGDVDKKVIAEYFEVDRENPLESDVLLGIEDQNTKKYRIKNTFSTLTCQLEPLLLAESDFYKLVDVLADCLLSKKRIGLQFKVCRDYLYPLIKHVLKFEKDKESYFALLSGKVRIKSRERPNEVDILRTALSKDIAFRMRRAFKIQILETPPDTPENNETIKMTQDTKLDELVDRFEAALRPTGDMTGSPLSEDFCKRNEIAREIVDCTKKRLNDQFIKGHRELSPSAKVVRRLLIEKLISDWEAEETFQTVASTRFPATKGFVNRFTPHSEPQIEDPIEFAQEIADLVTECEDDERNINITEKSGSGKFIRNLCQLSGHAIVRVSSWNEFSGNFIKGRSISDSVNKFRDSLRELLGDENFNSIHIYKLHIEFDPFDGYEEANFFKPLPLPPTYQSIVDFYEKFRLVINYPSRMKIRQLVGEELRKVEPKLDEEGYTSFLLESVNKWIMDSPGTLFTLKETNTFLQELNEHLNIFKIDEVNPLNNVKLTAEAPEHVEIPSNLLKTKFSELDYVIQKRLLEESNVILQGQKVKLGDLITSDAVDLIDEDTLLKLLVCHNGEESEIRMGSGRQFGFLVYNSFYVSRRIRQNFVDCSLFDIPINITNGVYYLRNGDPSDAIVVANTRKSFSNLKDRELVNFNGNVHWVQNLQGGLIWRDSIGSTEILTKIPGPRKTTWSEEQFLRVNDNRVVLVCGIPGDGKSRLLDSLSKELLKETEAIYTIRINLNMYRHFLDEKQQEHKQLQPPNYTECWEFLLEMSQSHEDTRLNTQFEINLFRALFDRQESVKLQLVVLLDGFDQIRPDHQEIVLNYMQHLKDCSHLRKLFITAQPNSCHLLERCFNTLGYEIKDLSNEDQRELFWHLVAEKGLEIEESEAKKFLKEARLKLSDETDEQFTAIPLHLKILAAIYAEKRQEGKSNFNDCNQSELFEMFVKQSYEIFMEDQMQNNQANATTREEAEGAYETFLSQHEKLALWALYNPEDLKQIIKSFEDYQAEVEDLLREIEFGQYKFGIVFAVIDGRPQFSHRTFAEYFSARYIHRYMERSAREGGMGILNIILNAENGPFLMFLNSMIPENRNWVCHDQGCSQITTGTISSTLLNLSQWSVWKVFDCVSDILKEESSLKRQIFIDIIERFPDDVNYFMLLGFLLKWDIDLTWTTPSGKTISHLSASEASSWKASSRQGKQSQFFYRLNQRFKIPLWLINSSKFDMKLFQPGFSTLDIFKMLMKMEAKCTADSDNLTPYHYAAASGNKDICEEFQYKDIISDVDSRRDAYIEEFGATTLFGKALRAEQELEKWRILENEKNPGNKLQSRQKRKRKIAKI
ncbi:uncharacterized protein LOC119655433 [Hermetia illucens]|uniref:uncharacterized protein LOC119655433 n=1 Tax=Hermetia illucens TaxID=343691 RepID=UPI0018CC33B5|nr:uncharacterized protein LOC119655433 [Hermetia illucens]